MHTKTKRRVGFSLVELLVVTGIITMLLTMILPSVDSAKDLARNAKCQANLHNLYLGYTQKVRNMAKEKEKSYFKGLAWISHVLPYVKDRQMLMCPSDPAPGGATLELMKIGVYTFGEKDGVSQKDRMLLEMPADFYMYFHYEGTAWTKTEQIDEDRYLLKFEDMAEQPTCDWDYNDVVLEIWHRNAFEIQIMVESNDAGYKFNLFDPKGDVIFKDLSNSSTVGKWIIMHGGSYGMNVHVDDLQDSGKGSHVLMMDYNYEVVMATGMDHIDNWYDSAWVNPETGLPAFARHQNRANVCWTDGSIRLMGVEELDPATVGDDIWSPYAYKFTP